MTTLRQWASLPWTVCGVAVIASVQQSSWLWPTLMLWCQAKTPRDTWRGPNAVQRLGWHRKHQRAVHREQFLYWGQRDSGPCKVQQMNSPGEAWGLCEIIGCPGIWLRKLPKIAQRSWVCQAEARSHQKGMWDIQLLPHLGGGRDSRTVSTLESIGFLHSC